ncbi:MAG: hypothetical protein IT204_07545 [Fimbriimonadaceae bacterium]|nr:hypothetical protein [Fimbriimonadaceae bacterium]
MARWRWLTAVLLVLGPAWAQVPDLRVGGQQPPPDGGPGQPPAGAPPAELWPPQGHGEYYGNSLGGLFGGTAYTDAPRPFQGREGGSLRRETYRGRQPLSFSGFADLGLSLRSVKGAAETFSQDQYGKDQTFSQNASLLVSGTLWKQLGLGVHAQIEQRSFGFNDTKPVWRVFWEDQNARVTFGDISPTVGDSNEFVPFSRRLKGLEAVGKIGNRFEYLAFGSQVGGSIRTQTFVGDGTPGPYYLTFVPIVDGSAVVLVDGVIQQAGYGETGDYTLNPSTGELIFNGTRIIPPTSRIEVRYETLGVGGPKDLLMGGQLRYTPTGNLRLGLQYITQLASTEDLSGPVERRVTDTITVPTPSSGPFTIRPRPIVPGSEAVQVNGLLQQRDVDYEIAYESGELRFFQVLPEGASILVRFSVVEALDLGSGDRSIFGFDADWSLGDALGLRFEFASSSGEGGSTSNPFSFGGSGTGGLGGGYYDGFGSGGFGSGSTGSFGSGYNSGSSYNSGFGSGSTGGSMFGSYRSRTGRERGDSVARGWDALTRQGDGTQTPRGDGGTAFKMQAASRFGDFSLGLQYKSISDSFSRIDSTGFFQNERGYSAQATYAPGSRFNLGLQMDRYERPFYDTEGNASRVSSGLTLLGMSWRFGPRSSLTATWNSQSNDGAGSGNQLSRQAVQLSHNFTDQISANVGFDHASSQTTGNGGSEDTTISNDSDTTAGRAGIGYNSSGGRFGMRFDYSFSGTKSSAARNSATSMMGSLNWQPFKMLSLQFSHQLSDSRNESLTGRTWDRVPRPGTVDYLLYRLDLENQRRQTSVTVPTDPLTGGNINNPNLTNSKTQNTTIGALLTPMERLSFNFTWGHNVTDNGRLAGSTSDSLQLNSQYQINDRIGFGLGYSLQGLKYSDTGDQTDTGIFNLNFDWRLSNHLDMRFDWQSMGTKNTFGPREEGEADPSEGIDPRTTYSSWGADLRWQLPGRGGHAIFTTLRNDKNSGGSSQNFSRRQFTTGFDYRITSVIGLRLSYDFTDYKNRQEQTDNSYTAHLFNAGVGARF